MTSPREHAAAVQELEGSIGSLTDSGPLAAEDAQGLEGMREAAAAAALGQAQVGAWVLGGERGVCLVGLAVGVLGVNA